MARKLSPKMDAALRETFRSEVGISYCTDRELTARSGIIEGWMIKIGTSVALIDRGMLSPVKAVAIGDYPDSYLQRQQITAAGCEAIGRSMDEIVAWAWASAVGDATAGTLPADLNIMSELPVEVGAVVGWTHRGEPMTGEVTAIFGDDATIVDSVIRAGWTVALDEIERVVELPKAELKAELDKFAKGEEPYPFGGPEGCRRREPRKVVISKFREARERDAQLQADLFTGRADRKALPIVPPAAPKGLMTLVNEAIAAAVHSEQLSGAPSTIRERSDARTAATAALEAVQHRLNLATALIPAEARAILDGRA